MPICFAYPLLLVPSSPFSSHQSTYVPLPFSSHHRILPPRPFRPIITSCPLAFLALQKGEGCRRRGEGSASARQLVTFQAFMRIDTLSEPTSHRVVLRRFRLKLMSNSKKDRRRILLFCNIDLCRHRFIRQQFNQKQG